LKTLVVTRRTFGSLALHVKIERLTLSLSDMLHAIGLTLVRLLITQRRLLEWETAAATAVRAAGLIASQGPRVFLAEMWAGPAVAILLLLGLWPLRPEALPVALPFLITWLGSPIAAWWLSRPVVPRRLVLEARESVQLRRIARRTWNYFEHFVGPEDHWLPPDNVQEVPETRVAHRTSPTNIGMGLLSTLAAYDFGYLRLEPLADRLESMIESVEALERYEGHLLNWYDTTTLAPLLPRYVSTVDSGNLAASLMTLASGLRQLATDTDTDERWCAGAADTCGVLTEAVSALSRKAAPASDLRAHAPQA